MKNKLVIFPFLLAAMILILCGCSTFNFDETSKPQEIPASVLQVDGVYSTPEDVAKYIHTYNKLPKNFITKKKAILMGWESDKGNLWEVSDQLSIGGDIFGNREGKLPSEKGRKWYECDVNYKGGYRNSERILYASDGLIYYTNDHYETFKQLY